MASWDVIVESCRGSIKDRLAALSELIAHVESCPLDAAQASDLIDVVRLCLSDNNAKTSTDGLTALRAAVQNDPHLFRPRLPALVPLLIDPLASATPSVRDAAIDALTDLAARDVAPGPHPGQTLLERMDAAGAWTHCSHHARAGVATVVAGLAESLGAEAIGDAYAARALVPRLAGLLDDPSPVPRAAAADALAALAGAVGAAAVLRALEPHALRPAQMQDVHARIEAACGAGSVAAATGEGSPLGGGNASPIGHRHSSPARVPRREHSEHSQGSASGSASAARRPGSRRATGPSPTSAPTHATTSGAVRVVETLAQLRAEVEAACAALSGTGEDWEARCGAMGRFEEVVRGGAGSIDGFGDACREMARALESQLQDRRSAVCRQATQLVGAMAGAAGAGFEAAASHLLPVLFRVAVLTVQVMAESARECVAAVLWSCHSPRLLPLLSQALRDKHRELRAAAAAWLLLVCEAWDLTRPALSRALPEIETTLLKGCEDADPRARALCRKAFAAYHARAPGNKGAAALSRAPPALQGRLGQECAEYAPSGEWAALEATYRPAGGTAQSPVSRASPTHRPRPAAVASTLSEGGVSRAHATPHPPLATRHAPASLKRPSSLASLTAARAAASSGNPSPASTTRVPSASATPTPTPTPTPTAGGASADGVNAAGAGAVRVAWGEGREGAGSGLAGGARRVVGASRSVREEGAGGKGRAYHPGSYHAEPDGYTPAKASFLGQFGAMQDPAAQRGPLAERRNVSVKALGARAGDGEGDGAGDATAGVGAGRARRAASARGAGANWADAPSPARTPASAPAHAPPPAWAATPVSAPAPAPVSSSPAPPPHPRGVVEELSRAPGPGKRWEERVELLGRLARSLSHPGAASEMAMSGDRVGTWLIDALQDPHRMVSLAAIEACTAAMRLGVGMDTQVERLLPDLLRHIATNREPHAPAAARCLAAAAAAFPPDLLIAGAALALDKSRGSAARIAALDWLAQFLAASASDARLTPALLRAVVQRAAALLADRDRPLRSSAASLLCRIHEAVDPSALAAYATHHATPDERANLHRHLAPALPGYQQQTAAAGVGAGAGVAWGEGWSGGRGASPALDEGGAGAGAVREVREGPYAWQGYAEASDGDVEMQGDGLRSHAVRVGEGEGDESDREREMKGVGDGEGEGEVGGKGGVGAGAAQRQTSESTLEYTTGTVRGAGVVGGAGVANKAGKSPSPSPAARMGMGNAGAAGAARRSPSPSPSPAMPARAGPAIASALHTPGAHPTGAAMGADGAGGTPYSPVPYTPLRKQDMGSADVVEGHFRRMVAALGDAEGSRTLLVMHQLFLASELARAAPPPAWSAFFPQVFSLIRPLLTHRDDGIREHAALAMRDLCVWQAPLAESVLETAVPDMLRAARDGSREVCALAEEALDAIVKQAPPGRCLDVILTHLPDDAAPRAITADAPPPPQWDMAPSQLQATLKCLGRVCARLPQPDALRWAPRLAPRLSPALSHPSADVRKAAVFAIVDLWSAAGDALETHLRPHLSDSHLRLVGIYVQRMRERGAEGDAE